MEYALAFAPVLILVCLLTFFVPVLMRLLRSAKLNELSTEWLENFQIASYAPMQGLLAKDDFQFLSSQPGFDPSIHRKLRCERLRIFREYLNRLIVDYNRLHALANFVISQSPEDHSQLFTRLISLRLQFWLTTLQVEFSYLLCRLGGRSVSIGLILQQMEEISQIALRPPAKSIFTS